MIPCRYFVAASDADWDQTVAALDAAWGFPDQYTTTCAPPASELPHDSAGRPLVCVDAEFCEWPDVAAMLPQLIASGQAAEITEQQYRQGIVPRDNLRP
jgi:hypothetical protein